LTNKKNPSPSGEGLCQAAERVGILSAAYKSPRAAEVALTADLINLVIDL
jgi:hypothetical protein